MLPNRVYSVEMFTFCEDKLIFSCLTLLRRVALQQVDFQGAL